MPDPFPRRSIDRWGFLFFPSEFPRWENDRARRLISVNAQFLWWRWRGEISGDGCKAWLQSGKFQSRFPSVTPELSDRVGPLVILLELRPGHLMSFTADLDRTSSFQLQSLTPPGHHSTPLKQISHSGEIWWVWKSLTRTKVLLYDNGH